MAVLKVYDGSSWVEIPTDTADHGGLTGLADDDHTQYLLADGTRALTGPLATSSTIDGVDIAARDADLTTAEAAIVTNAGNLTTHQSSSDHDGRYFTETEHINTSAGAGDAGKPIKLDAAGHVDASMLNDADIDHGTIGGLADDDHTQYLLADGTRTLSGNLVVTGTVDGVDIAARDADLTAVEDARSWIKMKGRVGDEINNASYTQTDIFNANKTGWDPNSDFTETTTAGSQLVTCNFDGDIVVTVNIYATSAGARVGIEHRLGVGGVASYGVWNQSYHRNQNGCEESGTHICERFTVSNGDTVFLQSQRSGTVTTSTTLLAGTFAQIERVR